MKVFRNTIRLCFATVVIAVGLTQASSAGTLENIKARGKLICATMGSDPRFSMQNPMTRKLEGLEPDLCKYIADSLGVDVDYMLVSAEARVPTLLQGRADLVAASVSWSAQRAEQIGYSNVYFAQPFVTLVRKNSGITDAAELSKARFANIKGSLMEGLVHKHFPDAISLSYDDANQAFLALVQGKADAMAAGMYYLRSYQIKGGESKFDLLMSPKYGFSKIGFAVKKGDPEWIAYLNKELSDLEISGEGQKIYEKYFSDLGLKRQFKFGEPIH